MCAEHGLTLCEAAYFANLSYGAIYGSSEERCAALAGWLDFYNHRRPHGSLGHQPPLWRLEALRRNNLAGSYS